jgi:hypothetical protein
MGTVGNINQKSRHKDSGQPGEREKEGAGSLCKDQQVDTKYIQKVGMTLAKMGRARTSVNRPLLTCGHQRPQGGPKDGS